ncbi:MAG: ureidoglycolate lyase [Proteobacteria bacterium]|nr:ureidoglycolate lyase [Pseudomonadota bacterium]
MLSLRIEAGALAATALEAESFAPFGSLVRFDPSAARAVNEGRSLRADQSGLAILSERVQPVLAIYRAQQDAMPFSLRLFERHALSSQTFVALTAPRFLVVVAPAQADGTPDVAGARAFIGQRGEGVTYAPGIWHAPITALDSAGDFLMLMWEGRTADDCEFHPLQTTLTITP